MAHRSREFEAFLIEKSNPAIINCAGTSKIRHHLARIGRSRLHCDGDEIVVCRIRFSGYIFYLDGL